MKTNLYASNVSNNDSISFLGRLDWKVIFIYFLLVFIGWINIYSSEFTENSVFKISMDTSNGKQIINFGIALLVGFIILFIDARFFQSFGYVAFFMALGLLFVTLLIGKTINGAKGWLIIGGFQLQTAEFMKIATALALGKYLSNFGINMKNRRDMLISFTIIFIPVLVVLLQNDTGSALVFLSLFLVLFRMGLNPFYIIVPVYLGIISMMVLVFDKYSVLVVIGLISFILYYFIRRNFRGVLTLVAAITLTVFVIFGFDFFYNSILKQYQRNRIEVLVGKQIDNKDVGYNVHQSLIAIGSGGLQGKGYLKGTQTKYDFVPEQTTDFIFCTIGEEWGFLGSTFLIALFLALMYFLIIMAERQKYEFNRYFIYGAVSIIFFHFLINIAMTLGLFPVIGIPLPFISYGGSSMLAFTILLFICLKLDEANGAI